MLQTDFLLRLWPATLAKNRVKAYIQNTCLVSVFTRPVVHGLYTKNLQLSNCILKKTYLSRFLNFNSLCLFIFHLLIFCICLALYSGCLFIVLGLSPITSLLSGTTSPISDADAIGSRIAVIFFTAEGITWSIGQYRQMKVKNSCQCGHQLTLYLWQSDNLWSYLAPVLLQFLY